MFVFPPFFFFEIFFPDFYVFVLKEISMGRDFEGGGTPRDAFCSFGLSFLNPWLFRLVFCDWNYPGPGGMIFPPGVAFL